MRRVLIVEDEAYRLDWFREKFPEAAVTRDVDEAIRWLASDTWDTLFLDHDLGTEPKAGRDVAAWLIAHPEINPGIHIVVHSMNVVSAAKIYRELMDARRMVFRAPFHTLASVPLVNA